MKKVKKIISLMLVFSILLSSSLVFGQELETKSIVAIDKTVLAIEADKERTLDNVYQQLEAQGKTNMYYLFEAQIDEEFDVILDSYKNEKYSIAPNSIPGTSRSTRRNFTQTFNKSGSITYEAEFDAKGFSIFLNAAEAQRFYNKFSTQSYPEGIAFLVSFVNNNAVGILFAGGAFASALINNASWSSIINPYAKSAQIKTISHPLEGQATIINEWKAYPKATVYNVYDILRIRNPVQF